jgi:carbonic anhydrase
MVAWRKGSFATQLSLLSLLVWTTIEQGLYNYQNSGKDWPGQCQNTEMQSPINILEYQSTCDVSHTFRFQATNDTDTFNIEQDPSGLKISSYFLDMFLKDIDGKFIGFNSSFMKIKIPAEHLINGETFDMELQVTGDRKPGYESSLSKMTMSVLFNKVPSTQRIFADDPTYTLSSMMSLLDFRQIGDQTSNFSAAFAQEVIDPVYYFYKGSMTEPQCDEHLWVIMVNFLYLNHDDFDRIKSALFSTPSLAGVQSNSRYLQIKGDRNVIRGGIDCSTYFGYVVAFVFLFIFMIYYVFKLL